ncbi:DUF2147 domain-containing protein [Segetibacter koreensis]|uniref:DUF2147 domain-containing protein n=1 Tax=Segetibacter koreensis TaxID=398037 RepID=UPI00036C1398|nr:DUF2147 domain-containing protein [Segetibacter koreensis]
MIKIIIFCFALTMLFTLSFAKSGSGAADKIIGVYWSPKKDAKIEIFKKGDRYFGKSIWIETTRKDLKNPNPSLRERDLLGTELFTNFIYKGGSYEDGKIYDPESGKTYDCKMSFDGKRLKVRGYIGITLLGRTEMFERVM